MKKGNLSNKTKPYSKSVWSKETKLLVYEAIKPSTFNFVTFQKKSLEQ